MHFFLFLWWLSKKVSISREINGKTSVWCLLCARLEEQSIAGGVMKWNLSAAGGGSEAGIREWKAWERRRGGRGRRGKEREKCWKCKRKRGKGEVGGKQLLISFSLGNFLAMWQRNRGKSNANKGTASIFFTFLQWKKKQDGQVMKKCIEASC